MRLLNLIESYGEYPEIDKIFESSWQSFKLKFQFAKLAISEFKNAKIAQKETDLINDVVKGIKNLNVYQVPSYDINAFVIPGFYVGIQKDKESYIKMKKKQAQKFSSYVSDWDIMMESQIDAVKKFKNFSINKRNRIVTFKNNSSPVSIFSTYGTLSFLTPEQRVAIYLHEIGHWVDTAQNMPKIMFEEGMEKEKIFWIQHQELSRYSTRYQELAADRFCKMVGYGKELSEAFDQFGKTDKKRNLALLVRYQNYMIRTALKEQEQRESDYTHIQMYPTIKQRQEYLKDNNK